MAPKRWTLYVCVYIRVHVGVSISVRAAVCWGLFGIFICFENYFCVHFQSRNDRAAIAGEPQMPSRWARTSAWLKEPFHSCSTWWSVCSHIYMLPPPQTQLSHFYERRDEAVEETYPKHKNSLCQDQPGMEAALYCAERSIPKKTGGKYSKILTGASALVSGTFIFSCQCFSF